jgi:hypothetical protein
MQGLNPVSASGLRQGRRNEGLVCVSENPLFLRLHRSEGVVYLEQARVQCLNSGQHRGHGYVSADNLVEGPSNRLTWDKPVLLRPRV